MSRRLREVVLWSGAVLGLSTIAAGLAIAFLGFHLLVFRSGSMAPDITTGSLALARTEPAADLAEGDVVSVTASTGERITHRVVSSTVRGDTTSLVLKGDANSVEDDEVYEVREADRVVVSAPYAGYVLAHALTPPGLVASAALALMMVVLGFSGSRPVGGDARPGRHSSGPAPRRSRRKVGVAALAVVVATGVAATPGTPAIQGTWARFTDQATLRSGNFDAAPYFTCATAAPGIAAPVIWYRMDDKTGAALTDASGRARPGTITNTGNVTRLASGACARETNGAMGFTAPGYASSNDAFALPPNLTLSVWFRTSTTQGGRLLGFSGAKTGSSGTQTDRHLYMLNDGRLAWGVFPSSRSAIFSSAAGGTAYNDGKWHQAVGVLSSTTGLKLYVDGVLRSQNTAITTGRSGSGYLRLAYDDLTGWPNEPTSDTFTGDLDEVVAYTTEPTAAGVLDGYRAALPN